MEYFVPPKSQSVESVFPEDGKVSAAYGGYCMESGDADGGWIACPRDLLTILHSLEGSGVPRLLKPETVKSMLARPSYSKGPCWYGLGLDVSWYGKAWEHGGHIDGATSGLTRANNQFCWAVLCNYWPTDSDYTSLMSFAISRVAAWSRVKIVDIPHVDASTSDKGFVIKLQVSSKKLCPLVEVLRSQGYRIVWIDGYQVSGQTFFNLIFKQNSISEPLVPKYDLTLTELTSCLDKAKQDGLKPTHIDVYDINHQGVRDQRYALVLDCNDGVAWQFLARVPEAEYTTTCQNLKNHGLHVRLQCPFVEGNGASLFIAALFEATSAEPWPKLNLTIENYEKEYKKHTRYGHMLTYVKAYVIDGSVKFSAIWTNPGPYLYISEHDMSKFRLMNDFMYASSKGFHPLCICGYGAEEGHKYIAVCVKCHKANKRK